MSTRSLLGLFALLLAACAPDPRDWPVAHDLAAELPLAEASRAGGPRLPRPPAPPDRNLAASVQEGIALAVGARIDGYFEVDGRAALGIDGLTSRGGSPAVEVLAQAEGEPERSLARLSPGVRAGAWELPGRGARLVRWTLRATGAPAAWAIVRRPVIRKQRLEAVVSPRLAIDLSIGGAKASPSVRPRPNVVLYLIDTLRADRLGAYGSKRGLTPRIDAFARGSTLFEHAYSASSWTRPSTATILTGLSPLEHGVTRLDRRLPEAIRTLPERLHDAGYETAAWSANAHITRETGFAQGFDRFEYFDDLPRADALGRRALAWVDGLAPREGAPFFLYLHTIDPHAP
ncbi:MAG TPA: sulfatase, partial [Thermoanaerobaculia bacterium]|nr:sulfatase [Thermoanaerobaculia bacterium]